MKKIIVISSFTKSLVLFRLDLLKSFVANGFQVYALGPDYDENTKDILESNGIIFINYNLERNGINLVKDFKTIVQLRKIFKRIKPDIILPYTVKPVIYSNLAKKGLSIKSLNWITGLGYYGMVSNDFKSKISKSIMTFLYKFAFSKNDTIIFQNNDDLNFFKKKNILKNHKYDITPGSGINLDEFEFTIPDSQPIVFVFVARLLISKGIKVFTIAAEKLKPKYGNNVRFIAVGGLDENNPDAISQQEVNILKSTNIVEFTGQTNDVKKYLKKSSVFVLPSMYREGVPHSILEALAVGRAIITTDNVGCRETVIKDYNGFLVEMNNVHQLVAAMEDFIQNRDMIKTFGNNSRKLAEDKFDVKIVNKIINNNINN